MSKIGNHVVEMQSTGEYEDGWCAAEAGLSRFGPYPEFSKEAARWRQGWDDYHAQEQSR